jgi:spore coat protein U-like protein
MTSFKIATGALLAVIATPAMSATTTTTFGVTATVQATCQISATPLAFGTYAGTQIDTTSTITATCTNTTTYTVGLNAGLGIGALTNNRLMTGPAAAVLVYSSFRDAGRTLNWGVVPAVDTLAGTGNGGAQTITVYGRLGAGQFVAPGSYSDTLTATITF